MKKILAINIGNTNVNVGSFEGRRLVSHLCINNKSLVSHKGNLQLKTTLLNEATNILVASVNPKTESVLIKNLDKKHKNKLLKIGKDIKIDIPVQVEAPAKVGIDRLLNSLAAYRRTKSGVIVIDFGTAITVDIVSKAGEFMGGLILPGLNTCAYALNKQTAFLPTVDVKRPVEIIGKNTRDAIAGGIYLGLTGAVIHIIKEMRKKHRGKHHIIATGGDAKRLKKDIPQIEKYIPHLTLEGMRIAFAESRYAV